MSDAATFLNEIFKRPGQFDGGTDRLRRSERIVVYNDDFDLGGGFPAKGQLRDAKEKLSQEFRPFVSTDTDGDAHGFRFLREHFKHTQPRAPQRILVQGQWNREQGGRRDRRP